MIHPILLVTIATVETLRSGKEVFDSANIFGNCIALVFVIDAQVSNYATSELIGYCALRLPLTTAGWWYLGPRFGHTDRTAARNRRTCDGY